MYNSLKRQPDYKRRICWAEIVPTSLTTTGKQVAVVEYIGPYPDNISIHGNAKSANSEYVRTTPTVMTRSKFNNLGRFTQRWHWMARLVHQETWNRYKTQNTNRRKKPNLQTRNLQTTFVNSWWPSLHAGSYTVKGQTSMHNCVHVRPTTRLKKLLFHRCHAYRCHRSRPHIQSGCRLCYQKCHLSLLGRSNR